MTKSLYRIGRFAARRPWFVIGAWLAAAALVVGASGAFGAKLQDSFEVPGLDSQRATDLLEANGSDAAGLTAQIVLTPRDAGQSFYDSASTRTALHQVETGLDEVPKVLDTTTTISPDGRVALVRVQYPGLEELSSDDLENLKRFGERVSEGSPLQLEMGGDIFLALEEPQTGVGEIAGVLVAGLILLLAFGSFVAMGLPIGMALFGLALGISSLSLLAHLIAVPSWAPVIGSMVGLGVGIDYALFLLTRHREYLERGTDLVESIARAVASAGQVVLFAGGTVVIAILGLAVAGVPFMTAGGIAVAVIVLVMVAASLTLLPAFLGLAGQRIAQRRFRLGRPGRGGDAGTGWTRWLEHVSRHAWPYAIGVAALLVALAAPVLALRVGNPDDGTLPETRTERRAYDLVASGFGAGSNGPLVIAAEVSRGAGVVGALRRAIAADPGIATVAPAERDAGSSVATLIAYPTTGPQDTATLATLDRLRAEVLPRALAGSGVSAHVGGRTASFADVGAQVNDRLPVFIAAVVVLSFLLLTVVFRSLLVPLKAALLNLLSIGAAYGVMVMVFQWGWGAGLIGLEATVPIVSFIPMFMFAILFGLSMDYEVFLLSRVRDEYLGGASNEISIVRGIAGTARVITSAALIMISVFAGFILGEDPATKMFGLGLAVAIFIDAAFVRMILVPAVMKLLGDANWWLPGRLDRLLPTVDRPLNPAIETPGSTSASSARSTRPCGGDR